MIPISRNIPYRVVLPCTERERGGIEGVCVREREIDGVCEREIERERERAGIEWVCER